MNICVPLWPSFNFDGFGAILGHLFLVKMETKIRTGTQIMITSLVIMTAPIMMTIIMTMMMEVMTMMMTAAGCTAFLPWAAFVKCHRGAKFTFTNDSTDTTRALHEHIVLNNKIQILAANISL